MPLYEFVCEKCGVKLEINVSMSRRDELTKDGLKCTCGENMNQTVGKLNFSLGGAGWSDHGYGITEYERLNNLDSEKRIEEFANNPKIKRKMEGRD
jgi:putative FmdB family regulatory protein